MRMTCGMGIVALLACSLLAVPEDAKKPEANHPEAEKAIAGFRVPQGMKVELFAGDDQLANPIAFAIDEKGRLFIAETFRQNAGVEDNRAHDYWLLDDLAATTVEDRLEKYRKWATVPGKKPFEWYSKNPDRVRFVEDTNGDGRADKSQVFSRDFNHELDGSGAGLLAYNGSIYYTNIPNLWLLQDTNGDGKADKEKSLSYGYGVRDALRGHDMHGLVLGPDGKLYFSVGDRGYNITTDIGHHLQDELDNGGRGAVFRCNLDGTGLEVFATGLRNPQELAFDQYGNLFTVDNNSDSGDKARLVYIVEGGDTGWSMAFQTMEGDNQRGPFNQEKHWHTQHPGQPAWIIPPVAHITSGPSGFTHYPGVGLPTRYDNHFFIVDFTGGAGNSGVKSFAVKPKGAGFEIDDPHDFFTGVLATDVDFGYDGKMYVSDWIEGWDGTGRGRIYTLHDPQGIADPKVTETTKLIAGGIETHQSFDQLVKLLEHPDMRVRLRAQYTLVSWCDAALDTTTLPMVARNSGNRLARIHAIWAIGQILNCGGTGNPQLQALSLFDDKDAEIRAQFIALLGNADPDRLPGDSLKKIVRCLADESNRVRYFAAMSLGKLGYKPAVEPLVKMLRENDNQDVYLRHAGTMALARIGDAEAVLKHAGDDAPAVRMGIVLALRRMKDARLAQFLHDPDPLVVAEAARAIYDLQLAGALPALAGLSETMPTMVGADERETVFALHRRVLSAHLRLGRPENIASLAKYAADSRQPSKMRREAIEILADFAEPGPRDRVLGYYRPLDKRDRAEVAKALTPHVPALMAGATGELQAGVTSLASKYSIKMDSAMLLGFVTDAAQPTETRVASLRALAVAKDERLKDAVDAALKSSDALLRAESRDHLAKSDVPAALATIEAAIKQGELAERQRAFATLGTMNHPQAESLLAQQLDRLIAGDIVHALRLDVLEAGEASKSSVVAAKVAQYKQKFPNTHLLAAEGGDAERGRALFVGHAAAQCLRCHAVGGTGGNVGPDLTKVAEKNRRDYLLESLTDPGAKIAPGFGTLAVTLKDGTTLAGVLKSDENGSVAILTGDGKTVTAKSDDVTFRSPVVSAMPPMTALLTPREMRDVVEYLSTLK